MIRTIRDSTTLGRWLYVIAWAVGYMSLHSALNSSTQQFHPHDVCVRNIILDEKKGI
jgi:hypothetical protein